MRAGEHCQEHGNGYDDCSFLHRPTLPASRLTFTDMPTPDDEFLQCPHEVVHLTCKGFCNCPCGPCAPSRPADTDIGSTS